MRLAILFVSLGLACCAPVPVPKLAQAGGAINTEDGLLLLVPTVSADSIADGQPQKREIEYEVMAIPGELLRRQIRQISGLYNAPAPTPIGGSAVLGQPNYNAPAPVGGSAVLSTAGNILQQTGNNLNSIGDATVQNAGNAIQFITDVGQGAGATLAESAGSGLQYAGQLSGAVLRALLQVPAIKVRVVQRLLQSPQPLISVLSNFIANSADGAADAFEAGTGLLNEAIGIVIRLVQDTLALKGRAIAAIGEAGLGAGDSAIQNSGALIGAVIETGQNVGVVVGDGVAEVVNLGSSAGFPTFPTLPAFTFPAAPAPVIPQLNFPTIDQIGQEIENLVGPLFNKPPKAPKAPKAPAAPAAPVGGSASLGQPGGVALPLPQGGYLPPGK